MTNRISYESFLNNIEKVLQRKRIDRQEGRKSLFEGVSPGNVGNVFEIPPSPDEFIDTASSGSYGRPVRVLEIVGDDALGNIITVSLQQETVLDRSQDPSVGTPGVRDVVEGPLVGIVEFGAGAGLSSFEFDIPTPRIFPGFTNRRNTPAGQDDLIDLSPGRRLGGALLSLPASSMRVFVRNDANAPYLLSSPTTPSSINTNKNPATIRVHATYGRRPTQAKLTRSYPVVLGITTDGGTAQSPMTAEDELITGIPTYAERVFFPRFPLNTTTLSVEFFQTPVNDPVIAPSVGANRRGPYIIPAGSDGPLEINPLDTFIAIENPLGSPDIENMNLKFELAI